jgi:DNA-binding CsgD family transcriptional regulator
MGEWPLVGRGEELRLVAGALSGAEQYGGVVIAGRAGVGKSRLAQEAVAAAMGTVVRWVVGTVTSRSIPLGAFAAWTDGLDGNPLALVCQVIAAITEGAGGASVVVAVDDAHLLDDLSAFVLHQLVLQGVAQVVATIRTGEPLPDAVTALWKDGHLQRLELQTLSRADVDELLAAVLGAPVDDVVGQRMWELSRGNALFVRQLVDQERAAGRLRLTAGSWQWCGPVEVSESLIALVELQIGAVPDAVCEVVDLVAVGEPLERSALAAAVSTEVLEEAERRGLITLSGSEAGAVVRVGHPLYGEVRLARCGGLRRRRLRGTIAEALTLPGVEPPCDPLRLGLLWLDSDLPANPDLYLRAARAAFLRMDFGNAERLSAAALAAGAGTTAHLLHAHALILLVRSPEAEAELAALDVEELPASLRARYLLVRSANLLWPMADPRSARELIEDAMHSADSESQSTVRTARSLQLAVDGCPREAIAMLSPIQPGSLDGLLAVYREWAATIALGDLGRISEAHAAAERGHLTSIASQDAAYQGVGLSEFHVTALVLGGKIAEAVAVAQRTNLRCVDVFGIPRSVATAITGLASLGAGDLIAARQQLSSAMADFERLADTSGLIYRFSVVLVEVLARSGRLDEALVAADTMRSSRHPAFTFVHSDALLAEAWMAAADGRTTEARQIATRAAAFAREHGQWAREVVCLQTGVGFGDTAVVARLGELAEVVEGPRAALAARYARAVAADDGAELASVSAQFEATGDRLAAAQAAARAAAMLAGTGRRGSSLAASTRAHRLARECGAMLCPDLRVAELALPISARECEVVTMVARGMANVAIADALSMSVRTVEGHIYRACAKLGVSNRTDLTALITDHHRAAAQ